MPLSHWFPIDLGFGQRPRPVPTRARNTYLLRYRLEFQLDSIVAQQRHGNPGAHQHRKILDVLLE